MSIVLDALRRGRGGQTTHDASSAAQADAVLKTLGFPRRRQTPLVKQFTHIAAALAAGVMLGILLWTTVVWLISTYLQSAQK